MDNLNFFYKEEKIDTKFEEQIKQNMSTFCLGLKGANSEVEEKDQENFLFSINCKFGLIAQVWQSQVEHNLVTLAMWRCMWQTCWRDRISSV